jgi:spore coat polysaccharide biosynthesis predicted glycosyltransferase SpsG
LVTLGGADPDNVTLKVIQALQEATVEELEAVVVVGGSNPHYKKLLAAVEKPEVSIELRKNVTNMPELMAWADVAIAAGGSTTWELAFMGLPSLLIVLAENQKAICQKLGKMGITLSLGEYRQQSLNNLTRSIWGLLPALEQRQQMSKKGRTLVDSLGSQRVVQLMK